MQPQPPGPGAPYYPMQPPAPKRGFPVWAIVLLVLGGCVLLFGGIFVVLGIYGVRKYVADAKTAEARNSLGQIAKDAAAAYEDESIAPKRKGAAPRLCPSASRPVPTSLSMVSGKKYVSSPADWMADEASDAGFYCLKFSLDMPQYYQYEYDATPRSFVATAHGDLDGDGTVSTFVVRGQVGAGDALEVAPNIEETNPME